MQVQTVDFKANQASGQFTDSLKETGFAVIKNHPLDWSLIEEVYAEWRAFFNSDEKNHYPFDKSKQDGYVPSDLSEIAKGETVRDIKEFYHLYFPWGRYPESISDKTRKLFDQVLEVAKTLLSWVEANLPTEVKAKLDRPMTEMVSIERTLYRILYYPAMTGDEQEGAIRAAAHEDINLLTILPAATAPGLEAKDVNGNWHAVKVDPETLIINVGDMLQELTNFYYKSTTHRVVKPEGEMPNTDRLSMPLFLHAKADVKISERYANAEIYLNERLKELGLL